jgi:hypothetical protein
VLYTGSEYGRVVSVSVEDLVEGERDRSTRLFEVEERSKIPEKEVTKREREINLEGKISLVVQNRQTVMPHWLRLERGCMVRRRWCIQHRRMCTTYRGAGL